MTIIVLVSRTDHVVVAGLYNYFLPLLTLHSLCLLQEPRWHVFLYLTGNKIFTTEESGPFIGLP